MEGPGCPFPMRYSEFDVRRFSSPSGVSTFVTLPSRFHVERRFGHSLPVSRETRGLTSGGDNSSHGRPHSGTEVAPYSWFPRAGFPKRHTRF